MGEKATWDAAHLRLFCQLCASEVLAGHRPLGHLNKVGWKNVEDKFTEQSGKKLEHLQFKNKWDALKRNYTIFMELKNEATGLGWNKMRQTVDCDDKWWDEHLARCHDPTNGRKCKHVQSRKCGLPNLDEQHIMFGSAHVTGASAAIPGESSNSTDDDVHEVEKSPLEAKLSTLLNKKNKKRKAAPSSGMEHKEEKSPFMRMYKQTCSKIEEGVNKITTSIEASSASIMTSHVPTIAEAMKMLKECGVAEGTTLMHTATLLIIKPKIRELLASFETLEGRLDWLKREHEMKQLS